MGLPETVQDNRTIHRGCAPHARPDEPRNLPSLPKVHHLTLQYSESHGKKIIDTETVKEAVTVERLAEDMELELVELFPKQSDLRLQAVRLLMHLEESGPKKQTELAEELGLEEYAMSRLLAKLELHRYIVRRREGTDKIVGLHSWPSLVAV